MVAFYLDAVVVARLLSRIPGEPDSRRQFAVGGLSATATVNVYAHLLKENRKPNKEAPIQWLQDAMAK